MEQQQFDSLAYFAELGRRNKLAKQMGFVVDYCSGPGALEPMMQEYRDAQNFIFIDDTTSGNTFSNKVGSTAMCIVSISLPDMSTATQRVITRHFNYAVNCSDSCCRRSSKIKSATSMATN